MFSILLNNSLQNIKYGVVVLEMQVQITVCRYCITGKMFQLCWPLGGSVDIWDVQNMSLCGWYINELQQ